MFINDHIQLCQHWLNGISLEDFFWGTQFSDRRRQAGYDFERIKAIGWCRRTKMSAWLPATSWFLSLSHLLFRLFIFHLNPLDMNILLENHCLLDWKIPDTSQISIPDIPGSLLHWNPGVSGGSQLSEFWGRCFQGTEPATQATWGFAQKWIDMRDRDPESIWVLSSQDFWSEVAWPNWQTLEVLRFNAASYSEQGFRATMEVAWSRLVSVGLGWSVVGEWDLVMAMGYWLVMVSG